MRCLKCKGVFRVEGQGGERDLILVANDDEETSRLIVSLLQSRGFSTATTNDGNETLLAARKLKPRVAIIDVALPGMFGFDVCEAMKNSDDLRSIKIVLMAAIYDKTKYKRAPTSLYGADAYIEKHHIRDGLAEKIEFLVSECEGEKEHAQPVAGVNGLHDEAVKEIVPNENDQSDSEEHEKAKRLARIIVSDIALYNEQLISQGIKNNNLYELLKTDIEEGRRLFRERVPQNVWEKRDYLKECLENLVKNHSEVSR